MAEAPGSGLPSGYDEEFVNEIEEDFQCLICQLPLKEPVQTKCGHRFCKECLEEHFKRQKDQNLPVTCPADREVIVQTQDIFPDKATERKILSYAIKCPSQDCDWTGELRYKETHLKTCLFKLAPCTNGNCDTSVPWIQLNRHVTTTCQWRIIKCDHCSEPHPHCKMQDHTETCNKFPVTCPNSCGETFLREAILHHIERDCPLTLIPCPYEELGCETKVQRIVVESHLQSAMRLHLDLACVKLKDTERTTKQLMENYETLQKKFPKLNDTEAKMKSTEAILNDTKAKLTLTELKLNLSEVRLKVTEVELKDTREKLETTMTLVEKLKTRTFTWKINNFKEIRREAMTGGKTFIYSPPFTTKTRTESYGYNLKVKLYPNGNQSAKNTHLSVFILVMKGEYDAILPWPFKKEVKFTVIDQQEDPAKRENVTKEFTPDNDPESFARPTQEMNACGQGYAQFISHSKLHSRRYLVDDTLYFQVEVGP